MIMVMKRKAGRGGEAFMKGFAARVKVLVAAAVAAALIYLLWLPYVPRLKTENPARTAIMERRTRQAAEKGKKFQPQMFWMSKAKMSRYLVNAVMLAEDDTFYQHHGFDLTNRRGRSTGSEKVVTGKPSLAVGAHALSFTIENLLRLKKPSSPSG